MRKIVSFMILAAFCMNACVPPSCAQVFMPKAGEMVPLSPAFHPPILTGMRVYADDPFRLDFILDKGQGSGEASASADRLLKYFLASLTVPEKDLWVNLSPYEKDRIIPDAFGLTEMGRDLLAQDYLLKQITSSLMYPEDDLGKKFWAEIYEQAQEQFGTTDIPVDTFNKVWIVPSKAVVYERPVIAGAVRSNEAVAYVVDSSLKVMLETDYLAAQGGRPEAAPTQELSQGIIRQIILPALEKEVNEGRNFAPLRQVYNSLILASWYKKKIKESILSKVYVDQQKVAGVNIDDPKEAEKIWAQYVEAFKKGVFDLVKEEQDQYSQEMVPRKYFSGGVVLNSKFESVNTVNVSILPQDTEIIRSRIDAAEEVQSQDFISKIQLLKAASFEHKTMSDFVAWVEALVDARGQSLTDKEIDLLSESLNIKPWALAGMRNGVSLQVKMAKDFYNSIPDDGKINVYLMRDSLLLYLTEKTIGKSRPYAAYLSKKTFRGMARERGMVDVLISMMMTAVNYKLGFQTRGETPEMIPQGKLKEFKEGFFNLYQQMISGGELQGIAPYWRDLLLSRRQDVKKVTGVLRQYIHSIGISDEALYNKGVRYLDTTMRGTLPVFFEAVTRSYFEERSILNAGDKVDSKMFFSTLSEDLGFIKDKEHARALELTGYPVDFSGQLRDGVVPQIVSVGSVEERGSFILHVLLFQKELKDRAEAMPLLDRLKAFMAGDPNAVPGGVDAMQHYIDAINKRGSPLAVYKDRVAEYLKDEEDLAFKLAPEKPGDAPTMLKIFLGHEDPFNGRNVEEFDARLPGISEALDPFKPVMVVNAKKAWGLGRPHWRWDSRSAGRGHWSDWDAQEAVGFMEQPFLEGKPSQEEVDRFITRIKDDHGYKPIGNWDIAHAPIRCALDDKERNFYLMDPAAVKVIKRADSAQALPVDVDTFTEAAGRYWKAMSDVQEKVNARNIENLRDLQARRDSLKKDLQREGYSILNVYERNRRYLDGPWPEALKVRVDLAIAFLKENIDQHVFSSTGLGGDVMLYVNKDEGKVFVAMLDNGTGFPLGDDRKPVIDLRERNGVLQVVQREGSPGRGEALGKVNLQSTELRVFSRGYVRDLKKTTQTDNDLQRVAQYDRVIGSMIVAEIDFSQAEMDQNQITFDGTGGIDLTAGSSQLQTMGSGEGMAFKFDPAEVRRLQAVPGFSPVIMDIQPMNDLPEFLGLAAQLN